ncbi:MAG: hypothetical protein WBE68_27185 [Candidatus Nitrosopolaris sp.]
MLRFVVSLSLVSCQPSFSNLLVPPSRYLKAEGRGNEPIFHIVAGTSIGAIKAAILVIHVNYFKDFCFLVLPTFTSLRTHQDASSDSNPCMVV